MQDQQGSEQRDTAQERQKRSPVSEEEQHLNGWEFLQWLISIIVDGLEEAWDEHPWLCVIFAVLLIGLILVLTGHLDGALFWMWLLG